MCLIFCTPRKVHKLLIKDKMKKSRRKTIGGKKQKKIDLWFLQGVAFNFRPLCLLGLSMSVIFFFSIYMYVVLIMKFRSTILEYIRGFNTLLK